MAQHITVDDVKRSAAEAYKLGRLTAQHPNPEQRQCLYQSGGYHCAVGSAMTPETLAAVQFANQNGAAIWSVDAVTIERGVETIQEAHDSWARVAARCSEEVAARLKGEFLEMIDYRERVAA